MTRWLIPFLILALTTSFALPAFAECDDENIESYAELAAVLGDLLDLAEEAELAPVEEALNASPLREALAYDTLRRKAQAKPTRANLRAVEDFTPKHDADNFLQALEEAHEAATVRDRYGESPLKLFMLQAQLDQYNCILQRISNILKQQHDTAKSIIQNIKA